MSTQENKISQATTAPLTKRALLNSSAVRWNAWWKTAKLWHLLLLSDGERDPSAERPPELAFARTRLLVNAHVLRAGRDWSLTYDDLARPLFQTCLKYKNLDRRFQRRLLERLESGDISAGELLLKHNLWRVFAFAQTISVEHMDDLVQVGCLGYLHSLEKGDQKLKFSFRVYSGIWIQNYMLRYMMNHGRTIRLPVHVYEHLARISAAVAESKQPDGSIAQRHEVATVLNMTEKQLEVYWQVLSNLEVFSLDKLLDETDLLDELTDDAAKRPDLQTEERELRQFVALMLDRLDRKAQVILTLRFGLDGGHCRTLQEIGDALGYTRERIRQKLVGYLSRLRLEHGDKIREFLAA